MNLGFIDEISRIHGIHRRDLIERDLDDEAFYDFVDGLQKQLLKIVEFTE